MPQLPRDTVEKSINVSIANIEEGISIEKIWLTNKEDKESEMMTQNIFDIFVTKELRD